MEIDYTTLTDAAASKLWETMNLAAGNDVAPLSEQDDMVKFSVRSQVLSYITIIAPVVVEETEKSVKNKLVSVINESYDAGHDAEFTLMAVTAELSESE